MVKSFDHLKKLKFSKVVPTAFTERGLYMLATILKSEQAVTTTLAIIDTSQNNSQRNMIPMCRLVVQISGHRAGFGGERTAEPAFCHSIRAKAGHEEGLPPETPQRPVFSRRKAYTPEAVQHPFGSLPIFLPKNDRKMLSFSYLCKNN